MAQSQAVPYAREQARRRLQAAQSDSLGCASQDSTQAFPVPANVPEEATATGTIHVPNYLSIAPGTPMDIRDSKLCFLQGLPLFLASAMHDSKRSIPLEYFPS